MSGKKVVLIDGNSSEWFEQAIFILRYPDSAKAKSIVSEAEKIINDYMLSVNGGFMHKSPDKLKSCLLERAEQKQKTAVVQQTARKKKNIDYVSLFLNLCLILSSIIFGIILSRLMG